MVLLEKLSNSNFEKFRELSLERISVENYDKDFFAYYEKEKFFFKIFFKKFVKLFVYNGEIIGYIWYEVPVEIPIRIWSLYVKEEYLECLDESILKSFNNTILTYETQDDKTNNIMLKNLGFKKVNPSVLMNIKVNSFSKQYYIDKLFSSIENDISILEKFIYFTNEKYDNLVITTEIMKKNEEEQLRCDIQNSVFFNEDRSPLQLEDIENDIKQDYYIDDLSMFVKINNIAIGYGQVIYNRGMYTVVNFGIINEFRGYGFGKILLCSLIKACKEMDILDLYIRVEENNISALKLYSWIGFSPKLIINKWERK